MAAIRSKSGLTLHTPLSHYLSSSSSPAISASNSDSDPNLITTAVSILLSHRSRSRFTFLKSHLPSSGISPSTASSIILHLRHNPSLALRFFLFSHNFCSHNLTSFSSIIHTLARSRRHSTTALSLLRSAISSHPETPAISFLQTLARTYRSSDSAPFVFDLLIQAYLHSHHLDQALAVLSALRSRGIQPRPSTTISLLRSTASLRGSLSALHLFRDLSTTIKPNSRIFNTLLLSLYRDNISEWNAEVLADMARFGCEPNAFTYGILIAGASDVDAGWRLWGEMVGKGIRPDVTAYNVMMRGFCEAGEGEKVEEIYREMGVGGVEATGTTFEILIKGRCRAGDVGGAMAAYREMTGKGFAVGAEVVEEVIEGLCGKGMVGEGMKVLREEMGREGRVACWRRGYGAVIKGLCEVGRIEEAMRIQAEMAGKGLDADEGVYAAFICGFEKAGDFEMGERLRKEMGKKGLGVGDVGCAK